MVYKGGGACVAIVSKTLLQRGGRPFLWFPTRPCAANKPACQPAPWSARDLCLHRSISPRGCWCLSGWTSSAMQEQPCKHHTFCRHHTRLFSRFPSQQAGLQHDCV